MSEQQMRVSNSAGRPITRRKFLQLSAVGAAAGALVACMPAAAPTGSGAAPASGEEAASGPVQGGTLGLMGHQEVAGLSPDYSGPSVQETMILAIHDSVLLLDEMLVNQPLLAESFEVAEDGLTYTFNLRQGVLFHDGKELTAADVKYTYDYYRDPDNATSLTNQFLNVESVETPDDYTVVLNMSAVNAAFLVDGGQTAIVQSEYHAEVGEEAYSQSPIGTGPFKLVEFDPASLVLVEAFEDYFRGRPHIDMVRQEVVTEPSVRTVALETGDSDSALWPLLAEDSQRLAEDPNFTVITTSTGGVKHIMLNNQLPQLSDKRVRQALLYALDRQRIIDDLWSGAASLAHSNLAPKYSFYSLNDDPSLKRYEYDPEKAMALLDEAGWIMGDDGVREKDGQKLTFTCTTITGDQARRPIAEFAQQQFKEIGVDMQLAEAPLTAIQEGQRNGTTDSSLYNWTYGSVDPNPSSTLRSDGGQNWNNFKNERVDELIDQGISIADPEQRQPIYHEIQQIVVEEVPMLYLMYDYWYNVFSSRVKGLPEEANDGFAIYYNGLYKFWLDPAE
ncbi:MAG TPA: ABC transporter substrate-binding protein [Caldilineaceae bacterium]|nr:ABC transporter substrate-binding protein [Caldilineaceae bacterium]